MPLAYHHEDAVDLVNNDKIWLWSMMAHRFQNERRLNQGYTQSHSLDKVIFAMISLGVHDWDDKDRPWDSSTHAMRFVACLADRLWEKIEEEKARVHGFLLASR